MAEMMCLNECGQVLFENTALDDKGNMAVVTGTGQNLQQDRESGRYYMKCPKCGAKNGFKDMPTPEGSGVRIALDQLLD